jgi:hypothetical protein
VVEAAKHTLEIMVYDAGQEKKVKRDAAALHQSDDP